MWSSGRIAPCNLNVGNKIAVSGQLHAPPDLLSGKEPPGIHWIGIEVGLRADVNPVKYRKKIYNMKTHLKK
jgi:hypothetical protein